MDLKPCTGCFTCIKKGGNLCSLKDDRTKIEDIIMGADGVILASLVYVMQVTGLTKVFIDRMAYKCHRPTYFNKKTIAISTTGGIGLKETLNYLELVAGSWALDMVHKLGITTPPWPVSSKFYDKNDEKIQHAAEKFYKSLDSNKPSNTSLYISFKIFKELLQRLREYLPADYEFYKKRENYYYNTKIGVFKKISVYFMLKIVLFMIRDVFMQNKEVQGHISEDLNS